jgi:ornithine carbamoyltransferase
VIDLKDLLALKYMSSSAITEIIERATDIKKHPDKYASALQDHNLLMLFQKTSTRTRVSFELGIQQLGGRTVVMDWSSSNFAISPIRYEAKYVCRHMSLIMARLIHHHDVMNLAKSASVPVINGCCDRYHPTQALADLLTIYEVAGSFKDITVSYIGILNNVANCLVAGCTKLGIKVILVTPEINQASWDPELINEAKASGLLEISKDPKDVGKADFAYTDTWIDMEHFNNPSYADEKDRRLRLMLPYQLRPELFTEKTPYIMHDMPIHPGYEIAESLIESPTSVIFQQAENRLHVEKSLMLHLLGK